MSDPFCLTWMFFFKECLCFFVESRWEVPREGFISLKDQKIQTTATKKNIPKAPKRKHHQKGDKHKKKMKKDKDPAAVNIATPFETFGPLPSGNPYGHWEAVPQRYFS